MKRPKSSHPALMIAMGLSLFTTTQVMAGSNQELLDILLQNGAITAEQHTTLAGQAEKADRRIDKLAWAERVKISGDVRVRHEATDDDGSSPKRKADRQRIRARLNIQGEVSDEVTAAIRLASGGSATSGNETIDNDFDAFDVYIDRAFIDYHPNAITGLNLLAGKMSKPWIGTSDLIWDGDLNPDGIAANYKLANRLGTFQAATGVFLHSDGVDGGGKEFDNDLRLYFAQLAQSFKLGDNKLTAGISAYQFDDEEFDAGFAADVLGDGGTSSEYQLFELFGKLEIKTTPVPLTLYTQLVSNEDANGALAGGLDANEDFAWLFGIKTKMGKWSFDANYRDIERNAVIANFNDQDFAQGKNASDGFKLKAKYKLSKNFTVGATYFDADYTTVGGVTRSTDTLQFDLVAKFK